MTPKHPTILAGAIATALLLVATPALAAPAATMATSTHALTRISVVVQGDAGSDLILVPGLSSTRHVFDAAAAELAKRHRVHLVQIKGFGEPAGANASGPLLDAVVGEIAGYASRLGRPVTVAGHSLGGLAAMMTGLAAPGAIRDVVVIDALPFIGTIFGADGVAALEPRATMMADMIRKQGSGTTPDFTAPDCGDQAGALPQPQGNMSNSRAGYCQIAHGARASDANVVAQAMYDDMTTDLSPRLGELKPRLTVLYAQDDRLLPKATVDQLYAKAYAAAPAARLVRIEGSYHFIMQDQPERFLAELRKAIGDQ